jgi:hypothetical protein
MPKPLTISLGGLPIQLISDQAAGEYELVRRAVDFISAEEPQVTLKVHCGRFPAIEQAPVSFETNLGWQYREMDGKRVVHITWPEGQPYQVGIFPADFRSGEIFVARFDDDPERFVFPLSYPMGELYLMNLLGSGLGMLFHACGVIYEGKGYLFTGHGGAGKTTTARLWEALPGAKVVNDDKVIIRQEADGFRLYGTPWHGEGGMALPDSAPLSKVFILTQAKQNFFNALSPVEASGRLLARTFSPIWDAEKVAYLLSFLDSLTQTVPCSELGFLPDRTAVDFVLGFA